MQCQCTGLVMGGAWDTVKACGCNCSRCKKAQRCAKDAVKNKKCEDCNRTE